MEGGGDLGVAVIHKNWKTENLRMETTSRFQRLSDGFVCAWPHKWYRFLQCRVVWRNQLSNVCNTSLSYTLGLFYYDCFVFTRSSFSAHCGIGFCDFGVFTNRRHSRVGSVLGPCIISHCAHSVKAVFPRAWVRIPPKPYFNQVLSSSAPLGKIYRAVPLYTAAHCSTERHNRRNPMPNSSEKLDQLLLFVFAVRIANFKHCTALWDSQPMGIPANSPNGCYLHCLTAVLSANLTWHQETWGYKWVTTSTTILSILALLGTGRQQNYCHAGAHCPSIARVVFLINWKTN